MNMRHPKSTQKALPCSDTLTEAFVLTLTSTAGDVKFALEPS